MRIQNADCYKMHSFNCPPPPKNQIKDLLCKSILCWITETGGNKLQVTVPSWVIKAGGSKDLIFTSCTQKTH